MHVLRTHELGALSAENIGETVTLAGWVARRRDHGGVAFVDLRDRTGITQCVFHDEADFDALRNEYVLKVTGAVDRRPGGNENPNLPTGEIEVVASDVVVLDVSEQLVLTEAFVIASASSSCACPSDSRTTPSRAPSRSASVRCDPTLKRPSKRSIGSEMPTIFPSISSM